jgi:hypothetical protein
MRFIVMALSFTLLASCLGAPKIHQESSGRWGMRRRNRHGCTVDGNSGRRARGASIDIAGVTDHVRTAHSAKVDV